MTTDDGMTLTYLDLRLDRVDAEFYTPDEVPVWCSAKLQYDGTWALRYVVDDPTDDDMGTLIDETVKGVPITADRRGLALSAWETMTSNVPDSVMSKDVANAYDQ